MTAAVSPGASRESQRAGNAGAAGASDAAGASCDPKQPVTGGNLWRTIKQAFSAFGEDKASRLGAAIAYYAIFSLAPLLLVAISVVGLVFRNKPEGAIAGQLGQYVGPEGGKLIEKMIVQVQHSQKGGIMAVVGLVIALIGASTVFAQLQDALNTIWEVTPRPGRGVVGMIKDRLLTFLMVLVIGALALGALVMNTILAGVGHFANQVSAMHYVWYVVNLLATVGVMTVLFAMVFKVLPDVKVAWKDVWVGGAITAVLFTIGQWGIGLYLGKAGVGSPFGAAGSLAVLLVWIFYSTQILLLGAEFTKAYACRFGTTIRPDDNAIPVTDEQRAQQGMPRTPQVQRDAARAALGSETADVSLRPEARAGRYRPPRHPSRAHGGTTSTLLTLLAGVFVGRLTKATTYRPVLIQRRPDGTRRLAAGQVSSPNGKRRGPIRGKGATATLRGMWGRFREGWERGTHNAQAARKNAKASTKKAKASPAKYPRAEDDDD